MNDFKEFDQTKDFMSKAIIAKHNVLYQENQDFSAGLKPRRGSLGSNSFIKEPTNDEFDIDLDVYVVGKPARYIYRPGEVNKLANFFHVENIKEQTRLKAKQAYESLKDKVSDLRDKVLV